MTFNLSKEMICIGLACLLVLVIVIVFLTKKDEQFKLENPMNSDNLSNPLTGAQEATYAQAYLNPPYLLPLPPKEPQRRLFPASAKPKNYSGIPKSMFKGSGDWSQEYTPDLMWCKNAL